MIYTHVMNRPAVAAAVAVAVAVASALDRLVGDARMTR